MASQSQREEPLAQQGLSPVVLPENLESFSLPFKITTYHPLKRIFAAVITWWNFADSGTSSPMEGSFAQALTPKESHHRLKVLIQKWRNL